MTPLAHKQETRNNQLKMDSQLFYFLNFILGGIFLFWFLFGRRVSSKPAPLNLKPPNRENSSVLPQPTQDSKHEVGPHEYPVKYTPRERDVTASQIIAEANTKNKKTAVFLYNGHDWDAYEVLGVASHTTLPQLTEKYQLLIKLADKGKQEFLETAYKALLKKF